MKTFHMSFFGRRPELIGAFRQGDRAALEQVYRHYVRHIDAYLRTLCNAAERRGIRRCIVPDLLQEVFIRAFSNRARAAYDANRDYGPYLRTIARNCFIDALRADGREVLHGDTQWPEAPADFIETDGNFEPKVLAILDAYLSALPVGLRRVYEQRYVLGRSQVAACLELGLTRRSLRTSEEHLKRGLRKALCASGITQRDLAPPMAQYMEAK